MSDITHETPTVDAAPPRRLVRVNEGRWLGGVAAGLGRVLRRQPARLPDRVRGARASSAARASCSIWPPGS